MTLRDFLWGCAATLTLAALIVAGLWLEALWTGVPQ